MEMNKNLKAALFYLFGNIFNKAIAFITIPIFTRIMTTSDYGIVNTYLSCVSIMSLIVGLSLGNSIRSAYKDFKENLDEYIASILFLGLINFLVIIILTVLIGTHYIDFISMDLVILCLIQSFMSFISSTMTIKYMMGMEYIKKTMLLSLPNIVTVILALICLMNMTNDKYYGRIIPNVIVVSFVGIYYLIKYFRISKKYINFKYWKYALTLSIPLVFHGLSLNILSSSDRIMITAFNGSSESGIYSLIYNFSMILLVITSSIESVWIPWFNRKVESGQQDEINIMVKKYIDLVVVATIFILMIGPEILRILAPEEYWEGNILIPPIMVGSFFVFLYSISVNLEYYYKSTKIIALNTLYASIINLILNLIFIPMYGSTAAAFTTVFSYVFSFAIHYLASRKLDKQLFPIRIYAIPIILVLLGGIIAYVFIEYSYIRVIWGGIIAIIFCIKYKNDILLMIHK